MRALICTAMLALSPPAAAATITVQPVDGGDPVVVVDGPLEYSDQFEFFSKTSGLINALIVFRGDGGDGEAALDIGLTIKGRGFATAVTDTCYSACAMAWLGGIKRFMSADAQIGFHRPYDPITGRDSRIGNLIFKRYATELGLTHAVVECMIEKGPHELNMLTKAEADRLGIEVDIYDAKATATPQDGAR